MSTKSKKRKARRRNLSGPGFVMGLSVGRDTDSPRSWIDLTVRFDYSPATHELLRRLYEFGYAVRFAP